MICDKYRGKNGGPQSVKKPYNDMEVTFVRLNLIGHFLPIFPPFTDRCISRRLTWSASGDEWGN
jgi:hypothetical protein